MLPMEAEHDNLQAVAAIGAFEEARPDEVVRVAGREVDAAVGQAVAVGGAGGMRARQRGTEGSGAAPTNSLLCHGGSAEQVSPVWSGQ